MTQQDLSKLQGADYFRFVANNPNAPANIRAGAQAWLDRNAGGTGAGSSTGVVTPPSTTQSGTPTQKSYSDALREAAKNDPRFAGINVDDYIKGFESGDWTGIKTTQGQPVSSDEANAELTRQLGVLDPSFQEDQNKATLDLKDKLGAEQAQYQNYLDSSASNFQTEKDTQDKTAADNGVLFSSGRVQKLNDLASKYASDAAAKKAALSSDVGTATRDYAYKYGTPAANDSSLSSFYSAGSNNYDPFQAKGGATKTGISSIYSPSESNFYGTNNALKRSQAISRASGVLASRYNKGLPYSYQYQY